MGGKCLEMVRGGGGEGKEGKGREGKGREDRKYALSLQG